MCYNTTYVLSRPLVTQSLSPSPSLILSDSLNQRRSDVLRSHGEHMQLLPVPLPSLSLHQPTTAGRGHQRTPQKG